MAAIEEGSPTEGDLCPTFPIGRSPDRLFGAIVSPARTRVNLSLPRACISSSIPTGTQRHPRRHDYW